MSGIFDGSSPTSIFGDCCCDEGQDQTTFHPEPVDCFADLTLPPPILPVIAGHRYIVENVSGPINAGWINLPLGLGNGDIIERDFQNLNWLLDVDISEVGEGPIVYVRCRCYEYWYGCDGWEEISPCNFGGYPEDEDMCVSSDGQTVFVLAKAPIQPDRTILTINGVDYSYGTHFIISGTILTWINTSFSLDTYDRIHIRYC